MARNDDTNVETNDEAITTPKRGRGRPKGSTKSAPSQEGGMLQGLMARMVEAIEQQNRISAATLRNAPKRRTTVKEHLQKHPRKRFIRDVYQNNRLAQAAMVSDENIALVDRLAPGTYSNGLIRVVRGECLPEMQKFGSVSFIYNNATIEQRMAVYMMFPSLNKMIEKVAAEMVDKNIPFVDQPAPPAPVIEEDQDDAVYLPSQASAQ